MISASYRSKTCPSGSDQDLALKLRNLQSASIVELRNLWKSLHSHALPAAFGPALLRHAVAHALQERAYGLRFNKTKLLLGPTIKGIENQVSGKLDGPRQIRPGSEFARTWKGKMHRVVVMPDGYAYAGRTFASLSEIARLITGVQWNGPRFFGLRLKAKHGKPRV